MTSVDLYWLWSSSNLHSSQRQFFTVWPPTQVDTSWLQIICCYRNALTNDIRWIYYAITFFATCASTSVSPFCHPLQGSYASSGCKIALTREFVWLGFGDVLGANIKSTWAHTSFSNTLHHGIQDGGHQYTESITSVYVLFWSHEIKEKKKERQKRKEKEMEWNENLKKLYREFPLAWCIAVYIFRSTMMNGHL